MERISRITTDLKEYDIDFLRLDDFMKLIKNAYKQGLITEDLYPNRKGNEEILTKEASEQWKGTKSQIEKLVPILNERSERKALEQMNTEQAGLALGQKITDEDKADVLAFELCKNMFSLVKNMLNYKGIYVNAREESIDKFVKMFPNWEGVDSFPKLLHLWKNWDKLTFEWNDIVDLGRGLLKVSDRVEKSIRS